MKKSFIVAAAAAAMLSLALGLSGCAVAPELSDYVSEYRSDIFEGTSGSYSVFATYSSREYPYEADGNAGEMSELFEVALAASDNTKTYVLTFALGGISYEEELSFDSVRMVHTFSRSLPQPTEKEITFSITDTEGSEPVEVTAKSVRSESALPLKDLLSAVSAAEKEHFAALTDGRNFAGELYIRLLHENGQCYYYVGLTDRSGSTYAMLADAETGEILATRGSD